MITVLIPTPDDDPALLETLAALVSGVADGVLRDAVIVGPPSLRIDDMAEAAGAVRLIHEGPRVMALKEAATHARADICLVLSAGLVPEGAWIGVIADAIRDVASPDMACFMPLMSRTGFRHAFTTALLNRRTALTGHPDPRQGLLVSRAALRIGKARFRLTPLNAGVSDRHINKNAR